MFVATTFKGFGWLMLGAGGFLLASAAMLISGLRHINDGGEGGLPLLPPFAADRVGMATVPFAVAVIIGVLAIGAQILFH